MKQRLPRKTKKRLKKQLYPFVKENTWLREIFKKAEGTPIIKNLPSFEAGWGNGYTIIPKTHRLYKPISKKGYYNIPVYVHGGLTFGNHAKELDWKEIPQSHKDGYVLGFDTAHYQDNEQNWGKEAVWEETLQLKKQLSSLKLQ